MSALIDAFVDSCAIDNLSPLTLDRYRDTLQRYRWWCHAHNVPLNPEQHTKQHVRGFLAWLQSGKVRWPSDPPDRPPRSLEPTTIQRYWAVLHRWYAWLVEDESLVRSPMATIRMPKAAPEQPDPFTADDLRRIAEALRAAGTTFHAMRDRAIVAVLLDVGLRRSELVNLRTDDVDLTTGDLVIRSGKGGKSRRVRLGSRARRILRRYWVTQRRQIDGPWLFCSAAGEYIQPNGIQQLMSRLGKAAGVANCHPHRFRHTAAVTAVRAGIGLLELQSMLGHTSLEMVRKYVKLAEEDVARAMQRNSPLDHLDVKL